MQLLLKLVKSENEFTPAATPAAASSLVVRIQAIQFLQVLLPGWSRGVEEQMGVLKQLIDALADTCMLVKPDIVLHAAHMGNGLTYGTGNVPIEVFWGRGN